MSTEIKTLRENVAELKSQVVSTDKKLDRIIFILNNDEGTGQPGLVAQVQDVKKKQHTDIVRVETKIDDFITEHKKEVAVKKAKIDLLSTIFGSIGTLLMFLLKLIWEKLHS